MSGAGELSGWSGLSDAIARERLRFIDRVVVLPEAASTQDAARTSAEGRGGLMLIAERQTAGRGRLGRSWVQHQNLGLAASFVLEPAALFLPMLPLAAGVAAAMATEDCLPDADKRVGLRWPNDVVERNTGVKIGGVLIEAGAGLVVVGFGINVSQSERDWPDELRRHAASLGALGAVHTREAVAERLMLRLDRMLAAGAPEVVWEWRARDVLLGTRRTFSHNGRRYSGLVVGIEPASEIAVQTDDGLVHHLPAATTSLVHEV